MWTYIIEYFNDEEMVETFYEKELQKKHQTEFRIKKQRHTKSDKLFVKWKGYYNSFNSWIGIKKYCYIICENNVSYFPESIVEENRNTK